MAIAACPLDDDRGSCKLISLQFVVCPLALYVRLVIIFVPYGTQEGRKTEGSTRTAHDCQKKMSRRNPLIYQLLLCSDLYERWIECVCTLVLKSKMMKMKQKCRVFFFPHHVDSNQRGCQSLSVPIGGDWDQFFSFFLQIIQYKSSYLYLSI